MKYFNIPLLLIFFLLPGCKRFLQKPADDSTPPPTSVSDVQLLLDNDIQTNRSTPGLGAAASDDIVLDSSSTPGLTLSYYGIYIWDPTYYQGQTDNSWSQPYSAIFYDNMALNSLDNFLAAHKKDTAGYAKAYGSALFYRSFHFFNLEETFGAIYDTVTAASALGIPLRLGAAVTSKVERSTVSHVYQQIILDLLAAAPMLPPTPEKGYLFRPCRAAAWGLLAKVFLQQANYLQAQFYSDKCLQLYSTLLYYDTINVAQPRPFDQLNNPELLFQCGGYDYSPLYVARSSVDSLLFNSYAANDCRKTLLYQKRSSGPGMSFRGSYSSSRVFSGLAVDEILLIRSESNAWLGDITGAMNDLNSLLLTRWKKGTFVPYTASTKEQTLQLVLNERRKELPFRETRWFDLRRLSRTPFAIFLKRLLGGHVVTPPPSQPDMTWWIPESEIQLSHITQN